MDRNEGVENKRQVHLLEFTSLYQYTDKHTGIVDRLYSDPTSTHLKKETIANPQT